MRSEPIKGRSSYGTDMPVAARGGMTVVEAAESWGKVLARAGLDFDFYLATKHYAVHYLYAKLNLPARVIAEQMGGTLEQGLKLLAVYGHGDVGALKELGRAFQDNKVRVLRVVNSDATQTQEAS